MNVSIEGAPRPFTASVLAALADIGLEPPDGDEPGTRLVECRYVGDNEQWDRLTQSADSGVPTVAIIVDLDYAHYAEAFQRGAIGAVFADLDAAVIADVIHAATQGEVVLPLAVAQWFAEARPGSVDRNNLSDQDINLLTMLSGGASVVSISDLTSYSERTVRRQLQNLYLRMGVQNRAAALHRAGQLRLLPS